MFDVSIFREVRRFLLYFRDVVSVYFGDALGFYAVFAVYFREYVRLFLYRLYGVYGDRDAWLHVCLFNYHFGLFDRERYTLNVLGYYFVVVYQWGILGVSYLGVTSVCLLAACYVSVPASDFLVPLNFVNCHVLLFFQWDKDARLFLSGFFLALFAGRILYVFNDRSGNFYYYACSLDVYRAGTYLAYYLIDRARSLRRKVCAFSVVLEEVVYLPDRYR